jgi:hypothetical protein
MKNRDSLIMFEIICHAMSEKNCFIEHRLAAHGQEASYADMKAWLGNKCLEVQGPKIPSR